VTTKRETGAVGFYRAYAPKAFDTLEEAIEWTMMLAEEWGLVEIQVNKRASRGYPENGGWFVAVVGKKPPDGEATVAAGEAPLP
jgi:hypothetical protein